MATRWWEQSSIIKCKAKLELSLQSSLDNKKHAWVGVSSLSPHKSSFKLLFILSVFLLCSFCSHIFPLKFLFLLHLVVNFSLCTLYQNGRIFFILEGSVLFELLDPVLVSFKSPFLWQYLLIYLFKLYGQTSLLFYFGPFIPIYPHVFFLPKHFHLLSQFLYLSF